VIWIHWTTAAWFLPFVLPIVIWVAWSDMATMRIPNYAVIALVAVFAVIGPVALPGLGFYLWHWVHFAVVMAIAFGLWTLRLIGAGDAKFLAAMAPFVNQRDGFTFLFLLGATVIAAFAVHRAVRASPLRAQVPDWESWTRREFPMGLALAPALLFYLLIGAFFGA